MILNQSSIAQEKDNIVTRYKAKLKDTTENPGYLFYPTIAFSPETKWEVGVVNLMLFYAKNDNRNRLSEANIFAFYTQESQYGIWAEQSIYTNKDKWFIQGKVRYQYFPLLYYGIGPDTKDDPSIINSDALIIHQRTLRSVAKNFFVGPMVDLYQMFNVDIDYSETNATKPIGGEGSLSVGLGISATYNSRLNPLNSKNADYLELSYLNYANWMGSDYTFQNIYLDARKYSNGFKENHVWANQAIANFNYGNLPFNMMAMIGGEIMMRGYYLGRFRDKNMIALQSEYRILPFSFSERFGATVFGSVGTVAPTVGKLFSATHHFAAGAGLRYNIFKSKDINVRFDAAVTPEGMAYYFFLGEAF